ncbi:MULTISPECIES: RagB/SusD family nutrient uptake outer membrane protein [Sphingobacterium]|uniref:RagB/SusD family nutrient uptake outer membrane protein n=1 Tax=Sphingobacterium litopenaei TaxID=2763500 RepID=A0ABR7Y9V0_9SPHI|nr:MULTISPECIES: RagB/SusD family nutrient uptake outer membrane protein [Sphingobacterium]MBD1428077.1 RagB/SusD family nutrient uptake outer membrane protein [Sphingobacterium litopenaei]NGM72065.1 RagB/SusD family nutrient uptake outer membrane protein [Sphingobacterium sp. SGL-16]
MKKLLFILGVTSTIAFTSCEDMFTPSIENFLDIETAYTRPLYAQGILLNGYNRVPTNSWSFNDVATDDAVTNDRASNYLKIATGQWTAMNNPLEQWRNSRSAIQYINNFLSIQDKVEWSSSAPINSMFNDRMKGEALGLRALFMFHLLQTHAGKTSSGEVLGIPIVLEYETSESDFNKPRATFEECMQQIYADLDKADELLPLDFEDISNASQIPAKYQSLGVNLTDYNQVFGEKFRLRMTKRISQAIRAKAALLAASPAFNDGNTAKWEQAANYAGNVIQQKGGISGVDPQGALFYLPASVNQMESGRNTAEIIWRVDRGDLSSSLEADHFPPTLFGRGRLNPTQNLVDAFPMANGYPINDAASGYNANSPYDNRDPRLKNYILVNGSTSGVNNTAINTAVNSPTNDGLNKVETSTRTGYYMRKLLRQDVNLNPSNVSGQYHVTPRLRMTEIYLAYAEAANEAWGPTGRGSFSFSAYDIIKAIRTRAGVGTTNGDPYLEQVKNNKDQMRQLIRNERRLELCFEGFRFWDLRRWNENLTIPAQGISIENNTYNVITVENRVFEPYMQYGPIPYSEILKYNNLQQNNGW